MRAFEHMRSVFEGSIPFSMSDVIKKDVEGIKKADITKRNSSGAINEDEYIQLMMKYLYLLKEGQNFYLNQLFDISDV